jgi:hypothetical protein
MVMLAWVLPLMMTMAPSGDADVRLFGGWIAGCDNEHICTAIRTVDAIDGSPAGDPAFLYIRHHPHRDAIPEIRIIDPGSPVPDGVLRSKLAMLTVDFSARRGGALQVFYAAADFTGDARLNVAGNYRFDHEQARTVLYALRQDLPTMITVGPGRTPIATAQLDDALAHFDREQDLEDTPGAMVLRPGGVMYDYAHPWPPDAPTVLLAQFSPAEFSTWLIAYLKRHPGRKVKHDTDPRAGLVTVARYNSPDFDCGVIERWGFDRDASRFALVERREMPVCSGIREAHWIRTFRADTISPD